jgi:hypothetical protein
MSSLSSAPLPFSCDCPPVSPPVPAPAVTPAVSPGPFCDNQIYSSLPISRVMILSPALSRARLSALRFAAFLSASVSPVVA